VVAIEKNQNEICFFFFFFFIFPPWLLYFLSPPSPPIFDSLRPVWWSDSWLLFSFHLFFLSSSLVPFPPLLCFFTCRRFSLSRHRQHTRYIHTYIHTHIFPFSTMAPGVLFVFLLCCCRAKRKSARNWNNPLNRRPTTTKPIAQPILY
jgi:hypothetical protein